MALDAIYSSLEGQITGTLSGKYAAVMGLVSGPLQTAMAINLVLVGYAIMRGVSNEPFGSYLSTWLKAYLVIAAATSSIAPMIAAAATSLPDQLASALGGGALSGQFDAFVDHAITPAKAINDSMEPWIVPLGVTDLTMPNLATWVMLLIVMAVAYVIAAMAMTMVLFVKFGLFVTIATMPIFVGALIFPSSSGLFFSWLGAVLNYAIQTAAVAIALVLVVAVVGSASATVGVGSSGTTFAAIAAMMMQLVALLVGGFLIMQAQSIGSFAGGGGSSGAGLLAAVYPQMLARDVGRAVNRTAARPMKWAGKQAARPVRAAAGGAGRAVRSGIRRMRGASSSSKS
ncbi:MULTISPECIES: type IV secretion system protein [unclassified Novosphingobium]|uniref:type IV secretion system protein n=1 Tax=unclassified Novosphingobium TaxID=2644732 RepID=UPI00146F67AA|nr:MULTISPECIES: type IV secretion system protein [unclassified Novosphingobium]NMN07545.1 type IV secretion system protein VirB6 [Novosphingobium sp. SG919]NMN89852.1 type IV secretion system protein VirB6 [Novosphingobium sp. SG916]